MTNSNTHPNKERWLLVLSLVGALVFSLLGIIWGIIADSGMMIFDGLYSMISVALSAASLLILRELKKGEDDTFPFGRYSLEPAIIVVRSLVLIGLFLNAASDAAALLMHGGRDTQIVSASIYALISTFGCLIIYIILKRGNAQNTSALITAESTQWYGDTLLSVGVLVGFCIALVMQQTALALWVKYVDPAMVLIAVACFLPHPTRNLVQAGKELLSVGPKSATVQRIEAVAEDILSELEYRTFKVHAAQKGRILDVELNVLIDAKLTLSVKEMDDFRMTFEEKLLPYHREVWIDLNFTAHKEWL